jgi:hypothetical protein
MPVAPKFRRSKAQGSKIGREPALKGRHSCLCRPCRAGSMPVPLPGLAPWALLFRPFGAVSGLFCIALSGRALGLAMSRVQRSEYSPWPDAHALSG